MEFITPNWLVPPWIRAATILKTSGVDLSLASSNRILYCQKIKELLQLPSDPVWLKQVHGNKVVMADQCALNEYPEADASIANYGMAVCAILTADCLPILISDIQGSKIAAIHAGWKSQVEGIIEATFDLLELPGKELLVWLGPAISAEFYEVGAEVYQAFMALDNADLQQAFRPSENGKWFLDLYLAAKIKLQALGIPSLHILGGDRCTYSEEAFFYSYRRTKTTKRMATLVWFHASI